MNDIEGTARRWGSSLAIVIPKEIAEKEGINEGDKLHVLLEKHADLSDVFGTLKTSTSGQKFKDLARKGWD